MISVFRYLLTATLAVFALSGCMEETPFSGEPVAEASEVSELDVTLPDHPRGPRLVSLKAMDWNIYVGTDVGIVLNAPPDQIPFAAAEAYRLYLSTNFAERAERIADFIRLHRPHLIGLQEVAYLERNGVLEFEHLDILMDALARRNLPYRVAGVVTNADISLPMVLNPPTLESVRLVDRDVILARRDVRTDNVEAVRYQAALPLPDLGLSIPRGYVALDATVNGRTIRFVNTHLEAFVEVVRNAQAQELLFRLQNETNPIVLVGDFNSPAPDGPTYLDIEAAGYVDIWPENLLRREGPGYTSPHAGDLRNTDIFLDKRIDQIWVRTAGDPIGRFEIGPVLAVVVGDELRDRTRSGLWPSDHAGVVARMLIPIPRRNAAAEVLALER